MATPGTNEATAEARAMAALEQDRTGSPRDVWPSSSAAARTSPPSHDGHADADVLRIENEIASVRDDLGRTVAELGTRLTPAHLIERARTTIKDATVERTRAVAQSAGDMASDVAERTRQVAADATDQVRAHPGGAAAAGAGLVLGVLAARQIAFRTQRTTSDGRYQRVDATAGQIAAAAAAVAVAWWVWKGGRY